MNVRISGLRTLRVLLAAATVAVAGIVSLLALSWSGDDPAGRVYARLIILFALGSVVSTVLIIGGLTPRSASAVPPNDNLANAITITTPSIPGIAATGDNVGATTETNEKASFTATDCPVDGFDYGTGATVWYNWTAPSTGAFVFDTFGSSIDTTLAVYSGSAFPLTLVACREGSPVNVTPSALAFAATSGITYRIQIGSWNAGATGNVVLSISARAGIYVNSAADTDVRDTALTLREAMLIANSNLAFGTLSPGEQALVLNGAAAGASGTDLIHFNPANFDINLGSSLPTFQFGGGHVSGIGATVEVDGQGTIPESCFRFNDGVSAVSGLTIRRCPVGVWVESAGNRVGGSASSLERNIIRENSTAGIRIDGPAATNNHIVGNYIGTNAAGGAAGPGNGVGVQIEDSAANNFVGGTSKAGRNIISGNGKGVRIFGAGAGNVVRGNHIGLNAAGSAAVPNTLGIEIIQAANNIIGPQSAGSFPDERNVISGNSSFGIHIDPVGFSATTGNVVRGNYIGLAADGATAIGNLSNGIQLDPGTVDGANVIGGSTSGEGNVISGNSGSGVSINGSNGNFVRGNIIGLDAGGTLDRGNSGAGVSVINGSSNNAIGGALSAERNVISGNDSDGVNISGSGTNGNIVRGNYIGLNAAATAAVPNSGRGVLISLGAANNILGPQSAGSFPGERNVISGNNSHGVNISGSGANGNIVRGNYVGLAPDGTTAIGNTGAGVRIDSGAANNAIGGSTGGEGNVISGNGVAGVSITGSNGNFVRGNLIGLDAGGTLDRGNGAEGIVVFNFSSSNTIGGALSAERNVISGNGQEGIDLQSGASATVIKGNYIGTNLAGTTAVGNFSRGVFISLTSGDNNTIGGSAPGERNVISGNASDGVQIVAGSGHSVTGNYIGTNASGTAAVPNNVGVGISSAGNTIGGTSPGQGNVISGNTVAGVSLTGESANGNSILGNRIGTSASGASAVPNFWGVRARSGARGNTIGDNSGGGNLIAFNNGPGVEINGLTSEANSVRGNSVHTNTGLGIDLVSGGNNSVAPPAITAGSATFVSGTACPGCAVDAYSDDVDEGRHYLGSTTASLGGFWSVSLDSPPPAARLTATATDAGNTSEFSATFNSELCDGVDNDGDNLVDEGHPNADGDNRKDCVDFGQMYFYPAGHNHTAPVVDCSGLPEDIDGFKDADGCPDPDNDNDGFPDSTDQCPGTDQQTGPDGALGSGEDQNHNGILDGGEDTVLADGVLTTDDVILTFEDYDGVLDTDGCHDSPGDDRDGDGYTDEVEALHIGTKADDPCGQDAWPSDLVSSGFSFNKLDIVDLGSFVAPVRRMNTSPGDEPAFDKRWDLIPGTTFGEHINIQDLGATITGPRGFPPMFAGQRAWNRTCVTAP
jgi:hypothetical protein